MSELTVKIHAIAEDGLPDMDALTLQVAFIFDGCIVSGWPLTAYDEEDEETGGFEEEDGEVLWKADSDVGRIGPFAGVTHWVEFPEPLTALASGTHPGTG
jgi:hypothetical protein